MNHIIWARKEYDKFTNRKMLLKSKTLTNKAKALFGDCVIAGYIGIDCKDDNPKFRKRTLKMIVKFFKDEYENKNGIELNNDNIFIKFNNGNMINFSVTEYGSIKNAKDSIFFKEYEIIK